RTPVGRGAAVRAVGVRGATGGRPPPPGGLRDRPPHPADGDRPGGTRGAPGEGVLPGPGDRGPGAPPRPAATSPGAPPPRRGRRRAAVAGGRGDPVRSCR